MNDIYSYHVTPKDVLFKIQANGDFRAYNLGSAQKFAWQNGVLHIYFGTEDYLRITGAIAEELKNYICKYTELHKEPVATMAVNRGTVESTGKAVEGNDQPFEPEPPQETDKPDPAVDQLQPETREQRHPHSDATGEFE